MLDEQLAGPVNKRNSEKEYSAFDSWAPISRHRHIIAREPDRVRKIALDAVPSSSASQAILHTLRRLRKLDWNLIVFRALVSRARFVTALTSSVNHCVRARPQHRCHMTEMLELHSWWNVIRRSDSAAESRRTRMIDGTATRWCHHDGCRDPDESSDRYRRLAPAGQRSRAHTGGAVAAPTEFRCDGLVPDARGLSLFSGPDLSGSALCAAEPARDCAPHRGGEARRDSHRDRGYDWPLCPRLLPAR